MTMFGGKHHFQTHPNDVWLCNSKNYINSFWVSHLTQAISYHDVDRKRLHRVPFSPAKMLTGFYSHYWSSGWETLTVAPWSRGCSHSCKFLPRFTVRVNHDCSNCTITDHHCYYNRIISTLYCVHKSRRPPETIGKQPDPSFHLYMFVAH